MSIVHPVPMPMGSSIPHVSRDSLYCGEIASILFYAFKFSLCLFHPPANTYALPISLTKPKIDSSCSCSHCSVFLFPFTKELLQRVLVFSLAQCPPWSFTWTLSSHASTPASYEHESVKVTNDLHVLNPTIRSLQQTAALDTVDSPFHYGASSLFGFQHSLDSPPISLMTPVQPLSLVSSLLPAS